MSNWNDPINRMIQILLNLANIADEKKETPFDREMGLGYRAFTSYVRQGVKSVIDLQGKVYSEQEKAEYAKISLEDNEECMIDLFGRKDAAEFFDDDEKKKIRELVKQFTAEAEKEADNEVN